MNSVQRQNTDQGEDKRKKRGSTWWKSVFLSFCKMHAFNPRSVIAMAVAAFVALISVSIASVAVTTNVVSRPVQFGLRDIGELATQSGYFTMVETIKEARELFGAKIPFTQSKYIFSYDGVLKAGIDFSAISVDVNSMTNTIEVTLPEVRILNNEIDVDSLEIYDESRNIFTPLTLDSFNESMQDMKDKAQQTAVENGLLEQARQNAEMLISGFLAGMYDMQQYSVVYK